MCEVAFFEVLVVGVTDIQQTRLARQVSTNFMLYLHGFAVFKYYILHCPQQQLIKTGSDNSQKIILYIYTWSSHVYQINQMLPNISNLYQCIFILCKVD